MTVAPGKLQALADLYQAVSSLRPYVATPDQQAALRQIEEAAARLADPQPALGHGLKDFDASRLQHLMTITGPELAAELLARLTEDLTATEVKLAQASGARDWKALREGSHVLISLSGSVGALSLQAMAESLNACAHARDADLLDRLIPPLAEELAALIRLVRATVPPGGTAA